MVLGNNAQVFDLGDVSHYDLVGAFNDGLTVIISYLVLQLRHQIIDLLFNQPFDLLIEILPNKGACLVGIKQFAFLIFDPTDRRGKIKRKIENPLPMFELKDIGDVLLIAELKIFGLLCEFAWVLAFGLEEG